MEPLKILGFALLSLSTIRLLLNLQTDVDTYNNDKDVKSDRKPILILDVLVQPTQDHLRESIDKKILKIG